MTDKATGVISTEVQVHFPYDAVDVMVCDAKEVATFFGSIMTIVSSVSLIVIDTVDGDVGMVNEVSAVSTLVIAYERVRALRTPSSTSTSRRIRRSAAPPTRCWRFSTRGVSASCRARAKTGGTGSAACV